jgi:hypothetical protein
MMIVLAGAANARAELLIGLTTGNQLIRFDSGTPGTVSAGVAVNGLQAGESLLGIDLRPADGSIYGLGSSSRLYRIDAATGAATAVGAPGAFALSGTAFGFDFNPTVDRIRVVSDTGQNLRLNPNDGALAATDGPLAFAAGDVNAGATPNAVGSAYTNNFAGATTTTLYNLDARLGALLTQNPPNAGTLNTVGSLGVPVSGLAGFDISGPTGLAYAALAGATGGPSVLYRINLAAGAATALGTIGGGVPLRGLTVATAVPEPGSLALLGLGAIALAGAVVRKRSRAKAGA